MSNLSDFINAGDGGGGINELEFKRENFVLDEINLDVDFGTVFDIFDCATIDSTGVGSIWFNFTMPDGFDYTKDILFDISYSLSGNDPSKDVHLEADIWINDVGDIPSESSPDLSLSEDVESINPPSYPDIPNIGVLSYYELQTIKIDESNLDSNTNKIAIKFTRNGTHANDTYLGAFQLISIKVRQPEEE